MSQDTLKSVYYSYFHSLTSYGINFGVILQTVFMSFDYKSGQLESLLGQNQVILIADQGRRLRVASGATAPGPALEGAPRSRPMSLSSYILR